MSKKSQDEFLIFMLIVLPLSLVWAIAQWLYSLLAGASNQTKKRNVRTEVYVAPSSRKPSYEKYLNEPSPMPVVQQSKPSVSIQYQATQDGRYYAEVDWAGQMAEIRDAWRHQNYDVARIWLQKLAYATTNDETSEEIKASVKKLITEFAKVDPLYRAILERVLPVIRQIPGVVQSDLMKDYADITPEDFRYVMYFAHEIGDVVRKKSGRSYILAMPSDVARLDEILLQQQQKKKTRKKAAVVAPVKK